MNEDAIEMAMLAGLNALTISAFLLPSPTALHQLDNPAQLHHWLVVTAVLSVAIGAVFAKMANHHAPVLAAMIFAGLVAAIYLIEERRRAT